MDRRRSSAKKKPAAAAASAPVEEPAPVSEPLSSRLVALYYFGIVFASVACIVGIFGVLVLMDVREKANWYSHTLFASTWLKFTENNPFITTACVNGGAATVIFCAKQLYTHRQAVQALKAK